MAFLDRVPFPVADSLAQVLRIQLSRDTGADYNDRKFKSLLLQCTNCQGRCSPFSVWPFRTVLSKLAVQVHAIVSELNSASH